MEEDIVEEASGPFLICITFVTIFQFDFYLNKETSPGISQKISCSYLTASYIQGDHCGHRLVFVDTNLVVLLSA